jgi:Zn ribbon nucleic-acid-binding protein
MFTPPPPRTPEVPPTPCPACHTQIAVEMYSTSRVHYYRCVACGEVWSSPDHHEPGHSAEAA